MKIFNALVGAKGKKMSEGNAEQPTAYEVNAENLEKFEKDEISFEDFSPEAQSQILNSENGEIEVKEGQGDPVDPKDTQEEVDFISGKGTKNEIKDDDTLKEKLYKKSNLNNMAAQALTKAQRENDAREERLKTDPEFQREYFKKLGINIPETKGFEPERDEQGKVDAYSESNFQGMHDELAALQNWKRSQEQEQAANAKRTAFETEDNARKKLMSSISDTAAQFGMEGKGFEEANAEYAGFWASMPASTDKERETMVDSYLKNDDARAMFEAKGIKAPSDYERTSKLIEAYRMVDNTGLTPEQVFLAMGFQKGSASSAPKANDQDQEIAQNKRSVELSEQPTMMPTTASEDRLGDTANVDYDSFLDNFDADTASPEDIKKLAEITKLITEQSTL
jgi:hypothetical protein